MRLLIPVLLALLFVCGCSPVQQDDPTPKETFEPAKTTAPAITQQPAPMPTPTPAPVYKSRADGVNLRSKPQQEQECVIGQLAYEQEATFLEEDGDYLKVVLMTGQEGYVHRSYLVPASEPLYAYLQPQTAQKIDIPTGAPVFAKDGVTAVMVKNDLVDLRLYLPDAQYELLFATDRNVLGKPLYPRAIPLIQRDVARKLQAVFARFQEDGYTLKIYDAYRPLRVQRQLFAKVKNSKWIANPDTTASNHNRGCAVDISLIDNATGQELEFPTPMHTFSKDSARSCKTWSEQAKKNVDYMTQVMQEYGFNYIESEWWHFSDVDSKNYMTTDIDLSKLTMLPKQEESLS